MIKEMNKGNGVIAEALKKAEELQPILNNVITLVKEEEWKDVKEGPLSGVPIALKDNVCTKGIKTTAASNILSNYVPIYDAHIVTKLKEAGATCIAKTSMDELAMGGTNLTANIGAAYNPWDTRRMTGGSSGGSASIVASGVVPLAIGSDTGDSVRKPASFCGVVGVKPTYGRISRYGIIPYASSLDHVGYFTRSVEDAALALEVLAGRDDRDMTSSYKEVEKYSELLNGDLKGKKIAIFSNVVEAIHKEETVNMFNKLVEALKDKGAVVDEYHLPDNLCKAILPTYYIIANCEATSNHSNLDGLRFGRRVEGSDMQEIMTNSRTEGFGPLIRRRFVIGSYGLFEENQEKLFRKAQKVRRLIVEEINKCHETYDAIIAPASADIAPLINNEIDQDELSDEYLISENYMAFSNFSGYPSMTVPMGFIDGCPIGVNISCRAFEEVEMFNIAKGIEDITGYKDMKAEVK